MRNGFMKFFINVTMTCIKTAIAYHFEVLFRYVLNKTLNKIHDSQGFFDIFIIFMAVVVKSNVFTVIFVNTGGCNYRSAKITANIFDNGTWIAPVGLGINIEAFPVFTITQRFDFFKR